MRGLILAGGSGSRLWPVTATVSKQLLPVYDKPMIYYPLSLQLMAGITDILVISTPVDVPQFQQLLGDGNKWGINLSYAVQAYPEGLAQPFIIGSEFIGNSSCSLVLGDNIFYGQRLLKTLKNAVRFKKGGKIFAYQMHDPSPYGVIEFDGNGGILDIEEKPLIPKSQYAVTGLYFFDSTVSDRARMLKPSARGELEITDLNRMYLEEGRLSLEILGPETAWFDARTCDSLLDAANFIKSKEQQENIKIYCPEEICWRMGYIDNAQLEMLAEQIGNNQYGHYLSTLLI